MGKPRLLRAARQDLLVAQGGAAACATRMQRGAASGRAAATGQWRLHAPRGAWRRSERRRKQARAVLRRHCSVQSLCQRCCTGVARVGMCMRRRVGGCTCLLTNDAAAKSGDTGQDQATHSGCTRVSPKQPDGSSQRSHAPDIRHRRCGVPFAMRRSLPRRAPRGRREPSGAGSRVLHGPRGTDGRTTGCRNRTRNRMIAARCKGQMLIDRGRAVATICMQV